MRETVPATILAHLGQAPRPSEIGAPKGFDRVIERSLAKDAADRYPSRRCPRGGTPPPRASP